jgi:hypothetical protein
MGNNSVLTTDPNNWLCLILLSVLISLGIRILNSFLRSVDKTDNKKFWEVFRGSDDQWLPFAIGTLEIMAYSLFLKADLAVYIGAWLVFKTVNRWNYRPKAERGLFNRYLLLNGLVLVAAYILAKFLYA